MKKYVALLKVLVKAGVEGCSIAFMRKALPQMEGQTINASLNYLKVAGCVDPVPDKRGWWKVNRNGKTKLTEYAEAHPGSVVLSPEDVEKKKPRDAVAVKQFQFKMGMRIKIRKALAKGPMVVEELVRKLTAPYKTDVSSAHAEGCVRTNLKEMCAEPTKHGLYLKGLYISATPFM